MWDINGTNVYGKSHRSVKITEFYCRCHSFFAKIPSNWRFTKKLYFKLIWRKSLCGSEFFIYPHTVRKNEKFFLSHWKKFRQINYLVISLGKPLFPRNFCENSVRENLCKFHTVCHTHSVENREIHCHPNFLRQINLQ